MKKFILLLLVMVMGMSSSMNVNAGVLTPYKEQMDPNEYVNGATFVLEQPGNYEEWLAEELQRAKDVYHLNTITVYGLENYNDAYKTCLFEQLKKLDMKICVRIESYDGNTFAFTQEDAAAVISTYRKLVEFTCLPENRDVVLYYALNMPVDDGAVQENLGGVNSEKSKKNQVTYAEEIVRLMRELTKKNGYDDAQLYLSVFYGWDASYDVPSYASANADGYFINNYTYPQGGELPQADGAPEDIINASRLKKTMDLFVEDYPNNPPVVIETGFHTLEYNNGVMPSQTAGLVYDRETKGVALEAVVDFYKEKYPFVRGLLYFGYNLFKEEGNPLAVMDWALLYPTSQDNEVEEGTYDKECLYEDQNASGGVAIELKKGQSVSFIECPATQQMALTYRAEKDSVIQIISAGQLKKEVALPKSEVYCTYGIPIVLVEDYDMEIVCTEGSVYLDKMCMFERMEAEYAECSTEKHVKEVAGASQGLAVEKIVGEENMLKFAGTRGGETLHITYMAENEVGLNIVTQEGTYSVTLPASQEITEASLDIAVAKGGDVGIYEDMDSGFIFDCLAMSGAPAVSDTSQNDIDTDKPKISTNIIIAGSVAGVIVAGTVAGAIILGKRRKK